MDMVTSSQSSYLHGSYEACATLADLHDRLGGIPLNRVWLAPPPGQATDLDLLDVRHHQRRICEIIDGVLVEKTMGYFESILAGVLYELLAEFVCQANLGIVLLPDNALRILPDQVRVPDVAFLRAARRPKRGSPDAKVPRVAPDLAVEVISEGNTPAEMQRKLADYFSAGVRLVWYIDPKSRSATVYTSTTEGRCIDANGTLDGGDVLPGFAVSLGELFAKADERAWSSDE